MADDLLHLDLTAIAKLIRARELSSEEVTRGYLERIERLNPKLNAFLEVFTESAVEAARRADREMAKAAVRSPIHGVPIAVKDILDLRGHVMTAGGILLPQEPSPEDAPAICRLREAGAVILGTLNLHEYAWGGTTNNPHFGPTVNPWKPDHSAGGSSGGSGAAVVARLCAGALGTDTLGSVRIPASYCGCVGLKPTFGVVSKRGVYPLSWSLDSVGPLAMTVNDAALLLQVLAGSDPQDPDSASFRVSDLHLGDRRSVGQLRLGVVRSSLDGDGSRESRVVVSAVRRALARLEAEGCRIVELDFPELHQATDVATGIALVDAAAIHRDHLANDRDKIGEDVRQLLELGAAMTGPEAALLYRQQRLLTATFLELLRQVDCLLSPTTPRPAHPLSELARRDVARHTAAINLYGGCAISVPCGFTDDGLPIGLQIAAAPFAEAKALAVARTHEALVDGGQRLPPGVS